LGGCTSTKAGIDLLDGESSLTCVGDTETILALEKDWFILMAVDLGMVSTTRVNSLGVGHVSIGFSYFYFLGVIFNALLDYLRCFNTGLKAYCELGKVTDSCDNLGDKRIFCFLVSLLM
jgi:hypothetical protein